MGGQAHIESLKTQIQAAVHEASIEGRSILLGGDFNSDIHSTDRYSVGSFLQSMNFRGVLNAESCTWKRGNAHSCIDQLVITGSEIRLLHVGTNWLRHFDDDHAVLCGKYEITGTSSLRHVSVPANPIELPITNQKIVGIYQTRLQIDENLTGTAFIEKLQVIAPLIVDKIMRRKRGRNRGLWSPVMVVTRAALRITISIMRRLMKLQKKHIVKKRHIRKTIVYNVKVWERRMKRLTREFKEDQLLRVTALYNEWKNVVEGCVEPGCLDSLLKLQHELRTRLQGRHRLEERMRIIQRSAERDKKCEQRRLGPVIRSMLGDEWRKKKEFDLHSLKEGSIDILDGEMIHEKLTTHFAEWFHMFQDLFEVLLDDQGNLKSYEEGLTVIRERGIPEPVWEAVYEGLKGKILTPAYFLEVTPTWEEFQEAVKRCKHGTAAGVSGFTYNMLKGLSDRMLKRLYEALMMVWEEGKWPESWNRRWLVPIPKRLILKLRT
jgi:hypothetical protein